MASPAAELARLLVAISVIPLLFWAMRHVRYVPAIRPWFAVVIAAIYLGYLITVLEGVIHGEWLNAVQHLLSGVAGVAAVGMTWLMRADVKTKTGDR